MKTSFSKRVLSVLLAVLMMVTSIPMMAFTALADIDDAATGAVDDAIQLYEMKMDGKVYTNMKAAYDAYLDAKEARDAYVYGDIDVDLNAVANKLVAATNAMTAWSKFSVTGTSFTIGSTTATSDKAVNLVYANSNSSTTKDYNTGSEITVGGTFKAGGWHYVYYPDTVMIYNGSDTSGMPVSVGLVDQSKRYDVYYHYFFPTTSGLSLNALWLGYTDNLCWPSSQTNGNIGYDAGDNGSNSGVTISNNSTKRTFGNIMYYTGTPTSTLTTISSTSWEGRIVGTQTMQKGSATGTSTYGDNSIFVLNVVPLQTAIENAAKKTADISSYSEGGMSTLIANIDNAINFNFSNYNYAGGVSSAASSCASAIDSMTSTLNSTSCTPNGTGYQALRTIFDDEVKGVKKTYNNGVNAGYTDESWAVYKTAYENAYGVFFNIMNTSYNNDAQAGIYAKALSDAYAGLELTGSPVDTTSLDIVLSNADYAVENSEIFTADSYAASNLVAIVNECKTAIWGSADQYGNDAAKIDDTEANQAIVEQYRQQLILAIANLKPNTAKTVYAYDNESLDSILVKAHAVNSAEYSNYEEILIPAITAGESFINNPAGIDATVENAVQKGVVEYNNLIADIYNAIRNLSPAFSSLPNGTLAHRGEEARTKAQAWQNGGSEKAVEWIRNNNQIIFKTTHDAADFDLGDSRLEFYCAVNYDAHFDSINLNDLNTQTGELNSGTSESGSATDVAAYPGGLTVTNNGGTFGIDHIFVTSKSSDILGKDGNGNNVTDPSFDFGDSLAGSSGTVPVQGAVTAKNGTTYAKTEFTLSVGATAKRALTVGTVPTKTDYSANSYFGMLYWWKHKPGLITYYGYAHGRTEYTQNATVIDISYLIDAINEYGKVSPTGYTTASYQKLADALVAAKADMDYENMDADAILLECKTRYNNLFVANKNLVPCANNDSIRNAIAQTQTTYQLGNIGYSPESWSAFAAAYDEAKRAFENEYSDANISNVAQVDQNVVDAVAQKLLEAHAGLVAQADFQPVYDAANALVGSLADKKFTVASLTALNETLAGFTYLNMSEAEKKNVFAESNDAIKAEAEQIAALAASEAIVDATTLEAAVAKVKAEYNDPDAWQGVEEAVAKINAINIYDNVTVYGKSIVGVKYDSQSDLDVEVTEILSLITPQTYTVYVDGVAQGTYAYGAEATVSADESVAWYYDYISNTANTSNTGSADSYSGKYYTTDRTIRFIVKGDTYLTTKSASSEADTVKVSYANGLKNKTYAVDYVTVGSTVTLETAPAVAYYDFVGYTVNDAEYAAGDQITVNKDTVVIANYELSESAAACDITMYFTNAANARTKFTFKADGGIYYNDLLEISTDKMKESAVGNRTYAVNGVDYKYAAKGTTYKMGNNEIYAWAMVPEEYVYGDYPNNQSYADVYDSVFNDMIYDESGNEIYDPELVELLAGSESIVNYGANYSFYIHTDMVLIALTKEEYDEHLAIGLINTTGMDANNAAVSVSENLVITETKFSMITTYALPEGAELVEGGILFTQDQSKDIASFNEVGNGVNRLKSSQHTVGNQFVISIDTTRLASGTTKTFAYAGYVTYSLNGKTYTVFSNPVFKTDAQVKA